MSATVRGASGVENFHLRSRVHGSSESGYEREGSFLDVDGESEWRGLGVQVALLTSTVDVTTALQTREYGSEGSTETALGVRWRLYDDERVEPYLFVEARHTRHESTTSEYVNGWSTGFGCLTWFSPNVFLDMSLSFEGTRGLRFPDDASSEFEVVYQVGIGYAW